MVPNPWHGAIHVYDDGQVSVQRHWASPDKPVTIHIEGVTPSEVQIKSLQMVWSVLAQFNFSVVSFDEVLLPYADKIMASVRILPGSSG